MAAAAPPTPTQRQREAWDDETSGMRRLCAWRKATGRTFEIRVRGDAYAVRLDPSDTWFSERTLRHAVNAAIAAETMGDVQGCQLQPKI